MKKTIVLLLFFAIQMGSWCRCSAPAAGACSSRTQMNCSVMSCCKAHHGTLTHCCAKELPSSQAIPDTFQLSPEMLSSFGMGSDDVLPSSDKHYRIIINESPPPKLCALTQSKAFRAPPQ